MLQVIIITINIITKLIFYKKKIFNIYFISDSILKIDFINDFLNLVSNSKTISDNNLNYLLKKNNKKIANINEKKYYKIRAF